MNYPNREIIEVKYYFYSGTMYGEDFDIEVNPNEVVRTVYFDEDRNKQEKEHFTYNQKLWEDLVIAIDDIWDLHNERAYPKDKNSILLDLARKNIQAQVLDGGDRSLYAIKYMEDGEKKYKEYYIPDDRRVRTILTLLKEIAYPTGRSIPHYDPPKLEGLRIFRGDYSSKDHFSFQCTLKDKQVSLEDRYLFVYYVENKANRSLSCTVGNDVWNLINKKVKELDLLNHKKLTHREDTACSLYMDDGKQKTVSVSKDDIEEFFDLFMFLKINVIKK